MRFIGVDLHSNQITVCYLTKAGKENLATFALTAMADFLKSLRSTDHLAVEPTGNTRWFVTQVKGMVEQVVVVNPNQFEVIRRSVKKTDRHDARALALFLSKQMLPEARMKSEQASEINSLASTRDKLVKLRTTLVNKLHALERGRGLASRKSQFLTKKGLRAVLEREWGATSRVEVEVIVNQIGSLNEGIHRLDGQLSASGSNLKGRRISSASKGSGRGRLRSCLQ